MSTFSPQEYQSVTHKWATEAYMDTHKKPECKAEAGGKMSVWYK